MRRAIKTSPRNCLVCGREFVAGWRKVCGSTCHTRRWREANREHLREYHRRYQNERRAKLRLGINPLRRAKRHADTR